MKIGLYGFFGQQDKARGIFRLDTCGCCKQMLYICKKLHELGHSTSMVCPTKVDKPISGALMAHIPPSNPVQCVHWDTNVIREVFRGCDVAVLWHEYLSTPVRAVYPYIKIIQICAVDPRKSPLLVPAWEEANIVVTQTKVAADWIHDRTGAKVVAWRMCYEAENIRPHGQEVADVLFVPRCSATNYSHHEEFLACDWDGLDVVFTDVTGYLRAQRPDLCYTNPNNYYKVLAASRVAVALVDDMFGGQAIREAIVSGCIPVVLDTPAYRELCGDHWPYFVERDFSNLVTVVQKAMHSDCAVALKQAQAESYDRAWPTVRDTILGVN